MNKYMWMCFVYSLAFLFALLCVLSCSTYQEMKESRTINKQAFELRSKSGHLMTEDSLRDCAWKRVPKEQCD